MSTDSEAYQAVRKALMDAENRLRSDARAECVDGETVAVHRSMEAAKACFLARSALIPEDCA